MKIEKALVVMASLLNTRIIVYSSTTGAISRTAERKIDTACILNAFKRSRVLQKAQPTFSRQSKKLYQKNIKNRKE